MMIGKMKKPIICSMEGKVMNIDKKDIEQYLSEVKVAVEKDNYRIDRNAARMWFFWKGTGQKKKQYLCISSSTSWRIVL